MVETMTASDRLRRQEERIPQLWEAILSLWDALTARLPLEDHATHDGQTG